MVVGNSLDSVFMVMEFCEHDLKGFMSTMRAPFSVPEVKCLMKQLLSGWRTCTSWTLHRDLKTSNILVNNRGELKICDFGLRASTASRSARTRPPWSRCGTARRAFIRNGERARDRRLVARVRHGRAPGVRAAVRRQDRDRPALEDVRHAGRAERRGVARVQRVTGREEGDVPESAVQPLTSAVPGTAAERRRSRTSVAIGPGRAGKRADDAHHTPAPLSDAGFDLLNRMLAYDPAKKESPRRTRRNTRSSLSSRRRRRGA